jgi:hypothetical protein
MAVNASGREHFRERVVKRLKRPPGSVHKAEATGMEIASGRHTGQAAHVVSVERGATSGKTCEIWREIRVASITGQSAADQGIKEHKHDSHGSFLSGAASVI